VALSVRERQIVLLVGTGLSSREIGARLGLSTATVNTHVGAAMAKLGARTRRQAAFMLTDGSVRQASIERLGARERRLLGLLADGLSVGQAARELGFSRRTADRRLREIRDHLGVATTAEAVVAAPSLR
jgi:DNA-binding CsgD family transcriptional regulator